MIFNDIFTPFAVELKILAVSSPYPIVCLTQSKILIHKNCSSNFGDLAKMSRDFLVVDPEESLDVLKAFASEARVKVLSTGVEAVFALYAILCLLICVRNKFLK